MVRPSKHLRVQSSSKSTRKSCEIYLKLTTNTVESRSGVFIVNFEHISQFL